MDTLDELLPREKNAQIRHCFPQRRGAAGAFFYVPARREKML